MWDTTGIARVGAGAIGLGVGLAILAAATAGGFWTFNLLCEVVGPCTYPPGSPKGGPTPLGAVVVLVSASTAFFTGGGGLLAVASAVERYSQ